jgi:hypothetical protein
MQNGFLTINKLEMSGTNAHLGGSAIFPKGVSEESVPISRLIFNEPFDNPYQIFIGRISLPITLGIIS